MHRRRVDSEDCDAVSMSTTNLQSASQAAFGRPVMFIADDSVSDSLVTVLARLGLLTEDGGGLSLRDLACGVSGILVIRRGLILRIFAYSA